MMNVVTEILVLLVLILLNGLFSMFEMAMVSSKRMRLDQRAEEGNAGAKAAANLLETPGRFLSMIQVFITLFGIIVGNVGSGISQPLAVVLRGWGLSSQTAGSIAAAIVIAVSTYLSLVIGELLPKRIALNAPEDVASSLAKMMSFLSKIARPASALLSASTDGLMKLLGIKAKPEPAVTEEEIKLLIEEGREMGVFQETEQDMVSGVFRLGERRVDALMTPRTEIVWVDLEDDRETIIRELIASPYSRIPVAKGELDSVQGVVNVKELVGLDLHSPDFHIDEYIRTPIFVPENTSALKLFEQFRSTGVHQALVIDEYGGLQGMVTLYDVLEAIVGDIPLDEYDLEQDAVQRADGSWLFDGLIPIDELKEILDIDTFPEEKLGIQTLSGFVMYQLGSIPKVGQTFDWERFRFEVVDMDNRRVDRVLVTETQPKD